ncbi:MAG: transposase [Candidatus Accumulibacter sp.]|uniref:Mu transposase C-terminal domain-containing protein n=1 Tax=Accumulibacter sp. TaxID=2053492 RepID=UPI001A40F736|nr:Mu transposase C-terminal domain-containing protein [Accumulibacter sp.]MBL8395939.1 transposase [Accumulibacter sp.]
MATIEAVNGCRIDPAAGWFSAQELAGLPGLPTTERRVRSTAEKNLWPSRAKVRSKAREYPYSALPTPTRDYLQTLAHDLIAALPAPAAPTPENTRPPGEIIPQPTPHPTKKTPPALPAGAIAARGQIRRAIPEAKITDSGRDYRDAALLLCSAIDEAIQTLGCSERRACEELARRLVAGEAHAALLRAAQATYLKPRGSAASRPAAAPLGGLTAQTARLSRLRAWYERGRLAGDPGRYLVPGARAATGHHPVQIAAFLRCFCRPSRPTIAEAHRAMAPWLAEHGLPVPSYATVARIQQDLPVTVKYRGRVTGSAWKALMPYVDRDLSLFQANDLWVGDGHSFKAKVQHPIHGQPFTPEVTVILDWVSRKVVGWSVSLSESTVAVSDAFRHAQTVTRARPLVYYSDNGAGQTGKKIDAPITGTLVRQGIAHHTGIPGNPQGRGVIERFWQSTLIPLARSYATCTWRGADENATSKVIKLLARKDGGGIKAPSWRQFLDDLCRVFAEYNLHHQHRDLARSGGDGTPEGTYQARLDRDSIVFGPTDGEIATLWMPEVIRTPSRGVVQLFGNAYFRRDLVGLLAEGAKLRVRYDLHDAAKVWLLDLDGRLIGEAAWNGHAKTAFPVPEIDRLRALRAAGKVKRGEAILAEAQAELGEVFEAAGIDPVPIPVADYLPVPADADDDAATDEAAPATMSHADLVMWLYGSAGADDDAPPESPGDRRQKKASG